MNRYRLTLILIGMFLAAVPYGAEAQVIETPGEVETVVGAGNSGFKDGNAKNAKFDNPVDVAVLGNTMFVADAGNHRIRSINLVNGKVSTFAGSGTPVQQMQTERTRPSTTRSQ